MGTNIEIKARAANIVHQRELASRISDTPCELIEQVDTFFEVPCGRLKLRQFAADRGELIHYDRGCGAGPTRSDYVIVPTPEPAAMREVLGRVLPVRGVVSKSRHLYLAGQTRIHLDEVADLGWFIELETVLSPGQSDETGEAITVDLMARLEICDSDLIECAYIDMLADKSTAGLEHRQPW